MFSIVVSRPASHILVRDVFDRRFPACKPYFGGDMGSRGGRVQVQILADYLRALCDTNTSGINSHDRSTATSMLAIVLSQNSSLSNITFSQHRLRHPENDRWQ
jgi:hypothetical protein